MDMDGQDFAILKAVDLSKFKLPEILIFLNYKLLSSHAISSIYYHSKYLNFNRSWFSMRRPNFRKRVFQKSGLISTPLLVAMPKNRFFANQSDQLCLAYHPAITANHQVGWNQFEPGSHFEAVSQFLGSPILQ